MVEFKKLCYVRCSWQKGLSNSKSICVKYFFGNNQAEIELRLALFSSNTVLNYQNIANLVFFNTKAPKIYSGFSGKLSNIETNYLYTKVFSFISLLHKVHHVHFANVFRTSQHCFSQGLVQYFCCCCCCCFFFCFVFFEHVSYVFFFWAFFLFVFQYSRLAVTFSIYQFIGLTPRKHSKTSKLKYHLGHWPPYKRCVQIMYFCHIRKCIQWRFNLLMILMMPLI